MKKTILIFLVTFGTFACKNDKPLIEETIIIEEKKPDKFIIELQLRYSESDFIRLFANDVFINNNRTMNISLIEKVTKSESFRTITLDLPENIMPSYGVGLNLGDTMVKSIEIKKIHISYGDIEFVISHQELKDYFDLSKYIDYNPESGVIQTKKIEGKLIPMMYLKGSVIDNLQ